MASNEKREDFEESQIVIDELKQIKEDRDVIDFMNIVDQVLVKVGSEVSLESDDIYEADKGKSTIRNEKTMFDRRVADVNKIEEMTHEKLKELNTIIREVGNEKELFKQDNKLEGNNNTETNSVIRDNTVTGSVIRDNTVIGNEISSDLSSEIRDNKFEGNRLIEDLKPFMKSKDKKNVIIMNTDFIGVKGLPSPYGSDLRIKKYPGLIYINLSSIERYMSTDHNVKSVTVRLESNDIVYETPEFSESSKIGMNTMVYLNVLNMERPLKLRLILQKNILNKKEQIRTEKVCETEIVIDKQTIEKIHNNLTDFECFWRPYTSNNSLKNFFKFFTNSVADAWSIKTNITYISEEELQLLGRGIPKDIYELSRWIKIKNHSYTSWYVGFVNIRGNIQDVCTFLWKRRFIQWKGYTITVYNEQSKTFVGVIDLLDISRDNQKITMFTKENKIRITSGKSLIEFHFDCLDKFRTFKEVIEAIL